MNLLIYSRKGLWIRDIPDVFESSISPYETVLEHIKNKWIFDVERGGIPTDPKKRIKYLHNLSEYFDQGWIIHPTQIESLICDNKIIRYEKIETNKNEMNKNELNDGKEKEIDTSCLICKFDFREKDILLASSNCEHYCHINCMISWFNTLRSEEEYLCPFCQQKYQFASKKNEKSVKWYLDQVE